MEFRNGKAPRRRGARARAPFTLAVACLSFVTRTVQAAEPPEAHVSQPASPAAEDAPDTHRETESCVEHHEAAQLARLAGQLSAARRHLRSCSSETCPGLVQSDCSRWFAEIDAMMPSIVVRVRRGSDDVAARLFVDGAPASSALDGRALELDPGSHELTIQVGEHETQTRTVLLSQGDKARAVTFELPLEPTPRAPAPVAAPVESTHLERPVSTWTYVLGGVAVTSLSTFVVLGSVGLAERNHLATTCSPFCSDEQLQGTRAVLAAADVALGIGVAAAAGAVITYLLRPSLEVQNATDAGLTAGPLRIVPGISTRSATVFATGAF